MTIDESELIKRMLAGDVQAVADFIEMFTPAIQHSVAIVLWRARLANRPHLPERDDLIQEAFLQIFNENLATLRAWQPARGPLGPFLKRVARNSALSFLRSDRRNPTQELPTELESLAALLPVEDTSVDQIAEQQAFARLCQCIREEFTPDDEELFRRLFLEQQDVAWICADTGLSRNTVDQRKHRLIQRIRQLRDRILEGDGER